MKPPDPKAVERAVAAFLSALGHEPAGELQETPALVAKAWCEELLSGYQTDPAAILRESIVAVPPAETGFVVLRGLAVTTMCPHHLLPALGDGTVLYLPSDRLAGFGAIARALDALTRRLTFQERAGSEMAALMVDVLGARGALCRLRLTHGCLAARGPQQRSARVESLAFAGCFADAGPEQAAALAALGQGGEDDGRRGTSCLE